MVLLTSVHPTTPPTRPSLSAPPAPPRVHSHPQAMSNAANHSALSLCTPPSPLPSLSSLPTPPPPPPPPIASAWSSSSHLVDILQCTACHQPLVQPVTLVCGYSICRTCLPTAPSAPSYTPNLFPPQASRWTPTSLSSNSSPPSSPSSSDSDSDSASDYFTPVYSTYRFTSPPVVVSCPVQTAGDSHPDITSPLLCPSSPLSTSISSTSTSCLPQYPIHQPHTLQPFQYSPHCPTDITLANIIAQLSPFISETPASSPSPRQPPAMLGPKVARRVSNPLSIHAILSDADGHVPSVPSSLPSSEASHLTSKSVSTGSMDTYQREWLTECTPSPGIFPGLPSPASGDARLGSITPESSTNTTLYSPGSVDQQALLTELECHICCSLPIRPVTTLCGHTFCQSCLLRTLDHNGACPLCRHSLGRYADYVDHQPNRALVALCEALFPNQMADRHAAEAAEIRQRQLEVPIFMCSLMFPTMPSQLYIYEPRYRLMMRHCLQASQKQFAMCIPGPPSAKIGVGYGRPDPAVMHYGTMMEIKSVRYLPDGQSVVQVRGIYRFRLLSYAMRNEYWTGRLERLDDVDKLEVELEHLNMPRYDSPTTTTTTDSEDRTHIDRSPSRRRDHSKTRSRRSGSLTTTPLGPVNDPRRGGSAPAIIASGDLTSDQSMYDGSSSVGDGSTDGSPLLKPVNGTNFSLAPSPPKSARSNASSAIGQYSSTKTPIPRFTRPTSHHHGSWSTSYRHRHPHPYRRPTSPASPPPVRPQRHHIRQLMLTCRQFIQRLHESKAPWLINRLEENAGPMPTTPEPFSFWMATVLPIDMYEKYKLLETRSTRERLRMISEWIEKLQTSMFFSNSCNLM
ncbi:hypothetical protein H4R33_004565 [Dimargaris cristalligena]|nr:hypothetical protein H4R33_004565 [Dimargaris cristalligena]